MKVLFGILHGHESSSKVWIDVGVPSWGSLRKKDPAAVGLELLGWILGHFVIFLLWVYKGPYI